MVNLLLLLGLITYSAQFKTSTISVSGENRGNVTLKCEHEDSNIVQIKLFTPSEIISVCQTEECRVFKEGNCDVVIKNLIFSDAGKYTLRIIYNNDQTELKPNNDQIVPKERKQWTYHLHIHDEISVKTGEELKMSVLVFNADKVKTNSSGEWKEVWTRGHGVQSDRMNDDTDGNLIISNFTARDTGSYRVLEPSGETLITVTVRAVVSWIALTVVVLLLALILTAVTLHKRLLRGDLRCLSRRTRAPEALRAHNDVC